MGTETGRTVVSGSSFRNRRLLALVGMVGGVRHGLSAPMIQSLAVGFIFGLTGCAAIVPAVPRALPGYGRQYRIMSENAADTLSGLLVLRSDYSRSPRRIAVFEITEGKAAVPAMKDVRFSYTTLMDLPVYWGIFENASGTYIFPLVPGYVCQEPYSFATHGVLSAPGWKRVPSDATIMLTPASPREETAMLQAVSAEMMEVPEGQRRSDLAARQRVLEYTRHRISQLQPTR